MHRKNSRIGRGAGQSTATARARSGSSAVARGGGYFAFKATLPDGTIKEWTAKNLLTDEGCVSMAGVYFLDTTQIALASWFCGLTDGTPTVDGGDTLASHAGWAEFDNVTETPVRQVYSAEAHATAGLVTNTAAPATFTLDTGGGTIGGAFICSVSSGTSGVLFCAAAFDGGDVVLPAASELQVTYITGVQDDGA